MYGAVGLLVAASLWNAWPLPVTSDEPVLCPGCQSEKGE
jgi:hypothetical protein